MPTSQLPLLDMNDQFGPQEAPEEKRKRMQADKDAKERSDAIDRQLKAEREEKKKTKRTRLLLLGSSESGKTTVLKQLKLIHGMGFEDERARYRPIVYLNVLTAMKVLTSAVETLDIKLADPESQPYLESFQSLSQVKESLNRHSLTIQAATMEKQLEESISSIAYKDQVPAIRALWADAAIQKCFENASDIGLQDSAKYFLDNCERFAADDYTPTDEDILQARIRTVGVTEHTFDINKVTYKIYDVGGHRSQRAYWAPYFDDVNAIIFMAAVSAYDQVLEEDPSVNRMKDSLELFKSICKNPLLEKTSIILFLNKIDILKKKLQKGNLQTFFPDYNGQGDFQTVTRFFQRRFLSLNEIKERHIYVHFTHATDTKQMRVIVASVNDIIQRRNLVASGLI